MRTQKVLYGVKSGYVVSSLLNQKPRLGGVLSFLEFVKWAAVNVLSPH